MKSFAILVASAVAANDVPAGKADIVTKKSGGLVQCAGEENSRFQVDQDKCYSLGAVESSSILTDQIVHCNDDGSFVITNYESFDGTCSKGTRSKSYDKDECVINFQTFPDAIFVQCPESKKLPNVVELAESVKDLSTLVSALVAGDLVDTLIGEGPFTVFAPTNDAFAALPAATLASLLKPENKAQLVDILTYHVLPAQALAKDLALRKAVTTVEGKLLQVQKQGDAVMVGPSSDDLKKVISADNLASNGVAHIIDGVLLPPSTVVV